MASAMRASREMHPITQSHTQGAHMAKNIILWMLGVPISVLILLNIFGVI
jgi:hypothetical protein